MKKVLLLLFIPVFGFSQTVVINEVDEFTKAYKVKVNCSKSERWRFADDISDEFNSIFLGTWYFQKDDISSFVVELGINGFSATTCLSEYEGRIIWLFEDGTTSELVQESKTICHEMHLQHVTSYHYQNWIN